MELKDLYRELIVDHSRSPRNFGRLEDATHTAEGFNPLCGDKLTLYVRAPDGRIDAASFEGLGCAISLASASLMTEAVRGRSAEEAETLFANMRDLLTGGGAPDHAALGRLAAFAGVKDYPTRVKCATLAWHTLNAALGQAERPVSTE